MIGQVLVDRYEILEKIGQGGMAVVYSAKDHLLNRLVAVKILRDQFAGDEEFVERFRREARSAAGLSHPNIVNIYDVGQMGSVHFIVMEYVQGQNLADLIQNKAALSGEFIAGVGKEIALGLAHAHYHGIIHRDIKPHNILITREGRVKVTDFGIAQAISTSHLTQTGMVLGSVHYFSPEQARGVNVQAASDLYSLGVVLYELITGRKPFRGESPIAVALKQIQERPQPLSHTAPEVDGELAALVLKLLAKNPQDRPKDAAETAALFQGIQRRLEAAKENEETKVLPAAAGFGKGFLGLARRRKKETPKTEGRAKKRKPRRGLLIFLIIFLILGGISYAVIRIIPRVLFPGDVEVPDIVGMQEHQGFTVLQSYKLRLKTEGVFDNNKPAGYIISQSPPAGRMVKENREITARVSKGPEEVEMPSVVGLSAREAKLNLTQTGFVLGEEELIYEPGVSPNLVLEQWPAAGETVIKGSAVNLVISKAQEAVKAFLLPDFRGQDFENVQIKLAELGLVLGSSWPEHSTVYQKGLVVEQNPAPGTEVEAGWSVDFVYSQGLPETPPLPVREEKPAEEIKWAQENLWHYQEVIIDVPDGPAQEIVILVIDDFGAREVYRETHKGGSRVIHTVQGRGDKAKLQVYIGARQFLDQYFRD